MEPIIPADRFEVFASGVDHPECVAFDRDGNLWAGGEAGQIYKISPAGVVQQVATLGTFNAGIAFSPDDDFLLVCNPAQGLIRVRRDGRHEVFATHAGDHKLICPNFAVFARDGSFYVTDSGQWLERNGHLCRFTPDGKGEIISPTLGYANGLALSSDAKTLYMVESDLDRVWKIDVATNTHETFDDVGRFPDGLALDDAGNLYVSCYASDNIWRVAPSGEKAVFAYDRWAIKLSRPTNMAFGVRDDDRDTMYVANLGRQTITRAKVGVKGQLLANLSTT